MCGVHVCDAKSSHGRWANEWNQTPFLKMEGARKLCPWEAQRKAWSLSKLWALRRNCQLLKSETLVLEWIFRLQAASRDGESLQESREYLVTCSIDWLWIMWKNLHVGITTVLVMVLHGVIYRVIRYMCIHFVDLLYKNFSILSPLIIVSKITLHNIGFSTSSCAGVFKNSTAFGRGRNCHVSSFNSPFQTQYWEGANKLVHTHDNYSVMLT